MTKGIYRSIVCLLVALILFFLTWCHLTSIRQPFLNLSYIPYTAPSAISAPASLEFKGLISDFFFLKMITSIGEKIGKKQALDLRHGDYIYTSCDIITDLDPFFWDPYIFGAMSLAWGFGDIQRANKLLFKAQHNMPYDFRPPYLIGFNYFYFLKDNSNGAKYLMEASMLPGCPSHIPVLAARLSIKAQEHKVAIAFLDDMLKKTKNKQITHELRMRLKTLVIMDVLEMKLKEYNEMFGDYPVSLPELVEKKLIDQIPEDPYGGRFYITDDKRVFTTSGLRNMFSPKNSE